jgi:TRAP transporter TAXI family solute receptor
MQRSLERDLKIKTVSSCDSTALPHCVIRAAGQSDLDEFTLTALAADPGFDDQNHVTISVLAVRIASMRRNFSGGFPRKAPLKSFYSHKPGIWVGLTSNVPAINEKRLKQGIKNMRTSSIRFGFFLGTAATLLLTGTTLSTDAVAEDRLTINGGQTKGAFNRVASGWAAYITKHVAGVNASSKASAGSLDNTRQVEAGKSDLGLVFASDLHDGVKGLEPFKKAASNVRYMTFVFGSVGHFVVPADSAIKSLDDIKGKTISMGGPGSGSAKNLTKLLKHVGLWGSFKDIYAGKKSSDQLVNGKVDAYNWHPGIGSGFIRGTANKIKIRFIDLNAPAKATGFYAKYPYFEPTPIPAGVYPKVDHDTMTIGTGTLMIANKNVSDDLVYRILKGVYSAGGKKFLTAAFGGRAKQMTNENGLKNLVAPLHPGAVKFWKEMGKNL